MRFFIIFDFMKIKIFVLTSLFIIFTAFAIKRSKTYKISTNSEVLWSSNSGDYSHNGSIKVSSGFVVIEKEKLAAGQVIIDMKLIIKYYQM